MRERMRILITRTNIFDVRIWGKPDSLESQHCRSAVTHRIHLRRGVPNYRVFFAFTLIERTIPRAGSAVDRNLPFAFPARTVYRRLSLLGSFSAFVSEPQNRTRPAGPLPEPKGHGLPHFKANSQPPLLNFPPSSRLVSPSCRAYPAGSGKVSICRSMHPNRRRARWLSANSSHL